MRINMVVRVKPFPCLLALSLVFASSFAAFANDLAPTPSRAPRSAVDKLYLGGHASGIPASRLLEGEPVVLDSERIKIDSIEMRLFGIIPPQLSASFGPQARTVLDRLAQGTTVRCQIHDRATDGRLLASCVNASNQDLALELLKRGLATTARGALAQSPLSQTYIAAEMAAQSQRLGLWGGTSGKIEAPQVPIKESSRDAAASFKIDPVPASSLSPAEKDLSSAIVRDAATLAASMLAPHAAASGTERTSLTSQEDMPFLERYQLLVTGILMLLTSLSIIGAVWAQKRYDKIEEIRAIAAALRGELMAARSICLARLQQFSSDMDQTFAWPRIRVLVFQAHVGRIGWLGAEMARQISSIYGLASDYASFYQGSASDPEHAENLSKRQALQKLVGHIDTVLPRLASVESKKPWLGSGKLFNRLTHMGNASLGYTAKPAPTTAPKTPIKPAAPAAITSKPLPQQTTQPSQPTTAQADQEKDATMASRPSSSQDIETEKLIAEIKAVVNDDLHEKARDIIAETKTGSKPDEKGELTEASARIDITKAETVAETIKSQQASITDAQTKIAPASITEVSFAEKIEETTTTATSTEKKTLRKGSPTQKTDSDAGNRSSFEAADTKSSKTMMKTPEPSQKSRLTAIWDKIHSIKETIHNSLVPHPEPLPEESDEYLAMLRDEAEAFTSYDQDTPPTSPTKRKQA